MNVPGDTLTTPLHETAATLDRELAHADPREVLRAALDRLGDRCAISFSGAEDVLLLEYAHQLGRPFRVFTLDTGRLHPETLEFIATVERRYALRVEVCVPDRALLEPFVRAKGLFSFYEDGHAECCELRKVEPLRRQLAGLEGWITGVRRDQSQDTRAAVPVVQVDPSFEGASGPLLKFNPLAARTRAEVWDTIQALDVPYNPLHLRGMSSIGCAPCTRPVVPGAHEREGRWWWERDEHKECGLHREPRPDEGGASNS